MIRKLSVFLAVCLAFSLFGCAEAVETPPIPDETSAPPSTQQEATDPMTPVYQQPLAAVSVPAITESLTSEDGTVLFQYTYQNMSLVLQDPEIADKIIIDFLNRMDKTKELAESTAQSATASYNGSSNWVPYLYNITYSPTRIDHGVLSLFGTNVLYNGAFHPDRTCISASYDMVTGDVLTLASIMSTTATADDFCKLVLEGLSEISEGNYLYDGYETTVTQRFMTDTSQDEAFYFTQTGLCFYFSPYEIAPYSSGVISVEIPYENLTGLMYDAYFPAERDAVQGTVTITPFETTDLSMFKQIAEIIENKEGNMYLGYTDQTVQDLRIMVSDAANSYTIFAAYELSAGDAFMVQANQEILENMILSYRSDARTVTSDLLK